MTPGTPLDRMTRHALAVLLAAAPLGTLTADDINIFAGVGSASAARPNVLVILDNTSNWSAANQHWPGGIKQGQSELNALSTVVGALSDNVNVGLMMFTNASGQTPDGGYVRFAMKQMTAANRSAFQTLMTSIYNNFNDPSETVSSSAGYGEVMFEAYKYFGGYTSPANANNNTAGEPQSSTHYGPYRYAGNPDANTDASAFTSAAKTQYIPASTATGDCPGKNYIVFIGNGFPNADSATMLTNVGGSATQIYNEYPASKNRYADEYARMLYQTDVSEAAGKQNVITYTINVYKDAPSNEQIRLMNSMAKVGGGTPFTATSAQEIEDALRKIFAEIQSVNSVFASASLPVSVNTNGTYLNQIFIGMFRPDGDAKPRWAGNLKQYKFSATYTSSDYSLAVVDKNGNSAINSATGFIAPCAVSFWTPSAADSYWAFAPSGTCTAVNGSTSSNTPDGEVVEKGGAAYKLRATAPADRAVKTCATSNCSAGLANFTTANAGVTASALGVANDTDKNNLVNWIRGQDLADEDADNNTTEMRSSAHGDVVHSRPLAIDFGSANSPDVKVFYGGNDGMFHAVNADQADSEGTEMWTFVAPEHWSRLKRLKDNSPLINFDGVSNNIVPTPVAKDYFFDGPIGVWRSGATTWIYPTMRRGGRTVYAFDVSTPASPTLKWKRGCPNAGNDTDCSADWSGIGQTWSEPRATTVSGYVDGNGAAKPLLIMGGGYDTCEDSEPANCSSPKGAVVFVADANDGGLLKTLATERSVIGDVALVDSDFNGKTDLAYVVDTGGNVYRINIGSNAPAAWTITKLASVGCDSPDDDCNHRRKFQYGAETVVTASDIYVLVGSGDREHPMLNDAASGVDNAFFMFKDRPSDATWLSDEQDRCDDESVLCLESLLEIDPDSSTTPTSAELAATKGWYLKYGEGDHDKEHVVTSAVVVGGYAYFSTYTPTEPTACGPNLGLARAYAVSFYDASPVPGEGRYADFVGGGLPPSPVAGVVTVDNPNGGGTINLPFLIGGKQDDAATVSPLEGQKPTMSIPTTRARAYWYLEK